MKIKTKFINLCKKLAHNFSLIILTILFLVASLILFVPTLTILIFRFCLSKCVTGGGGGKLTKILTSGATVFAADDVTGRPNLNVVVMLTVKGSVGLKQVRQLVQDRVLDLAIYPEFKQYYYRFMGFLFFRPEVEFKIENHVRLYDYTDLDVDDDENLTKSIHLQDLCRIKPYLMERGWPAASSPWEFLIVPRFRDDNDDDESTVLIFRFHHGMGDGFTFFNIFLNCLAHDEQGRGQIIKYPSPSPNEPKHNFLYYLTFPFRIHFDYIKQLVESNDENPWKLSEEQLSSAGVESAMTQKICLDLIKQIRDGSNVSFSAVLMAAVAGALKKTMVDLDVHCPSTMHALMPIPRRVNHKGKLRNYLSFLYTKLPVGTPDCGRRLKEADSNFMTLKNSTLPFSNGVCHQIAGSLTYPLVRFLQKNVLATVLLSNLPMPATPCYILGHEMSDISFSTSCHGNNGIRISIISYNSNLRISVEVSKALPPKSVHVAQQLVVNIETELKNMKNSCGHLDSTCIV